MRGRILTLLLLLLLAPAAQAVEPDEMLADPALEARARNISREIRCLVCQNQSIDDSSADLARDLRVIVRERLAAGDSDEAVKQFLVARYGEFVLLRPPLRPATWLLWFGPAALLLAGGLGIALYHRRRRTVGAVPLSETERRRVADLLGRQEAGR